MGSWKFRNRQCRAPRCQWAPAAKQTSSSRQHPLQTDCDFQVTALLDGATQVGPGGRAQWCPASRAARSLRRRAELKARPLPGGPARRGVWNRAGPSLQEEGAGGKGANSCVLRGEDPQIERHIRTAGFDPECSELHHKPSAPRAAGLLMSLRYPQGPCVST